MLNHFVFNLNHDLKRQMQRLKWRSPKRCILIDIINFSRKIKTTAFYPKLKDCSVTVG